MSIATLPLLQYGLTDQLWLDMQASTVVDLKSGGIGSRVLLSISRVF